MTKFNPADLTANIPDAMKEEAIREDMSDHIREAKGMGQDGELALIHSLAVSLAANMHVRMSQMLIDKEMPSAFREMYDALPPAGKDLALMASAFTLGYGLVELKRSGFEKIPDKVQREACMGYLQSISKCAADAAFSFSKDFVEAVQATRAGKGATGTARTTNGNVHTIDTSKRKTA